jgi:4-alpha-glucanotransferase
MQRCSGVLCPVSALPSRFGVGDFGANAKHFVDLLVEGGYKLWQILPLNPLGYGHSPYQPFSSFALEELYVDLDALAKESLLEEVPSFNEQAPKVLYEEIRAYKSPYLHTAFQHELARDPRCLEGFAETHPWVGDWAYFMMNKRLFNMASWETWPSERREMIKTHPVLSGADKEAYDYEVWLQKTLYKQWDDLHHYANQKGLRIVGDLPFYVGFDSCDVWAHQETFLLDPNTKEPLWIAGVPPDYFSKTGQRWGNPIYNWDLLAKTDFDFIINRIKVNASIYDVLRLDHFRAFDTYWKIPSSCPTAIEGAWIEAPGYKLFDTLFKKVPNVEIIAEDLGDLRPQVLVLRDHYNFPGMNVIEFTFHDAELLKKPGYDKANMVSYLGTHDNDPFMGYFAKLPVDEQTSWLKALDAKAIPAGSVPDRFLAYQLSLPCGYAVTAVQDLLGLGSETRLNTPGLINETNWTWRLPDFAAFEKRLPALRELNKKYNR